MSKVTFVKTKQIAVIFLIPMTVILAAVAGFVIFVNTADADPLQEQSCTADQADYVNAGYVNEASDATEVYTPHPNARFLDDFDHFLYVLENNFGVFSMVYPVHGTDIPAVADRIRYEILIAYEMSAVEFFTLLNRNFDRLSLGAHFSFIDPHQYFTIVRNYPRNYHWRMMPASSTARLNLPHVQAHYNSIGVGHALQSVAVSFENFLHVTSDATIRHTLDRFALFGHQAAAERIDRLIFEGRTMEAAYQLANTQGRINALRNIRTQILEDERIAYLSIDSFRYMPTERDQEQLTSFLKSIWNFEHLIIDLRRNIGGWVVYFTEYIMGPLIPYDIKVEGFAFLRRGEYTEEFTQSLYGRLIFSHCIFRSVDVEVRPTAEILAKYNLPQANMTDMENLDYGFRTVAEIPRIPIVFGEDDSEYKSGFTGQIWILTDPQMGSATEYAARIAKNTGFAILVGERTGGNVGGERIFVALPNTGILFQMDIFYVTDAYGAPLDAGTIPHHFNREGYDALETVLHLIKESEKLYY